VEDSEGASDSDSDSSEVPSSDSVGWLVMLLEGTGRAVGEGMGEMLCAEKNSVRLSIGRRWE
jgi:hypothetical protein